MRRPTVPLDDAEFAVLERMARAEKRSVGAQAAHLLGPILRPTHNNGERSVAEIEFARSRELDDTTAEARRLERQERERPGVLASCRPMPGLRQIGSVKTGEGADGERG